MNIPLRKLIRKIAGDIFHKGIDRFFEKRKDIMARKALMELCHNRTKRKIIKVGFVVQLAGVWDKEKSIFEKMCEDSRFDPYLIIVPNYDVKQLKVGEYDEDKDFFLNEAKKNRRVILAHQGDQWIDIKKFQFEYVFYGRPYDAYLPDQLQSSKVVQCSKTCYVPYATTEEKETITRPRSFFRNLYIGFLEDSSAVDSMLKEYARNCQRGLQQFVSVGYPVFERCMKMEHVCQYKKVMWTPRWTYDKDIGGSHFFEYVKELEEYDWTGIDFVIRPHPLMWGHFLRMELCNEEYISERRKNGKKKESERMKIR